MRRQETALAKACLAGVIAAMFGCASMTVQAQDLKKYDSSTKDFWLKPPPDWFLGDENKEQKGQAPNPGQPTPTPRAELDKILATIKLPPGFKIAVWADGVPQARQMAWGDKGTLFVGTFDKGTVHAVSGPDGQKVVKPFITGLRMPTGVAFQDGALYVVDIDKLYRYDNPEANLEKAPEGKVVYDDFPPYVPHGWKYLVPDGKGWFYIPVGVPCNICLPPASTGHYRRVDPKTGAAEIVALGVRNSVGGAVDPRSGQLWFTDNGRDWITDDLPSDELNRVSKIGEHFGYPYCHQGDLADPKYGSERKCSEFTPPVYKQGPHIAGLGMKFYTGDSSRRSTRTASSSPSTARGTGRRSSATGCSSCRSIPTARTRRNRSSPAPGSTIRRSSAVRPTSCRRPTAPCWSPTTRPVRSIASAIRSDANGVIPTKARRAAWRDLLRRSR